MFILLIKFSTAQINADFRKFLQQSTGTITTREIVPVEEKKTPMGNTGENNDEKSQVIMLKIDHHFFLIAKLEIQNL